MISVFANPAELEKHSKEKYAVPPFLMMENAARAMADFIISMRTAKSSSSSSVLIICGKGNNGGDGYALARLLQEKLKVYVICIEPPAAEEAKVQYEMCRRLGIEIQPMQNAEKLCSELSPEDFLIDCIYGTGFHGELSSEAKKLLDTMNASRAIKIACDIPSALEFCADYTITMGSLKLALFSDKSKNVCGKIITANLGISNEKFQNSDTEASTNSEINQSATDIFLIEESDIKLPFRKKRAAHKGTYGHTSVLCGDKAGAAILTATSSMNFGSGLTSIIVFSLDDQSDGDKTKNGIFCIPLSQFKISPSLMISDSIPKKTTCISAGSGFSEYSKTAEKIIINWFEKSDSPAVVLDAGMLTSAETPELLATLNKFPNARILLTPHLGELSILLKYVIAKNPEAAKKFSVNENDFSVSELSDSPEKKILAGKLLTTLFPFTTVIMKSANTFIAGRENTGADKVYIVTDGAQSLAKGGSGDILAGMTAALLAQGYSAKDAAITAAEYHALLSQKIGAEAYNLTPEKLLAQLELHM